MRILIVDDSCDFAAIFTQLLEQRKFKAEAVYSGEEAIERFKINKYETAFVDFKLPGKNGLDCLRELETLNPDCRFIVMSGYRVDKIVPEPENYEVIYKPFDMDKIMELLEENNN